MSEYRKHPSRWWYLVFAVGLAGLGWHLLSSPTTTTIAFSTFVEKVAAGEVTGIVEIGERAVTGKLKDGTRFETIPPPRTTFEKTWNSLSATMPVRSRTR